MVSGEQVPPGLGPPELYDLRSRSRTTERKEGMGSWEWRSTVAPHDISANTSNYN